MVFLHGAFRRIAHYYKLMLVAVVLAAASMALIAMLYPNEAKACGFWGPCTIPVYVTSFSASPDPIYAGFGTVLSWTSYPADFCVIYPNSGGAIQVVPNGSWATGALPAGWNVFTIVCSNVGGADEGTSAPSNLGVTVNTCPAGWSPSTATACTPPPAPTNDITVDCGGTNELGCPGGTFNNSGQVTKPTSGTIYLTVRTGHAPKTGDALAATGIVQLPGNASAGGAVNPDNYPIAPGTYSNAQVARGSAAGLNYSMPITSATPAGVYYFYPVTATNFYAWNNYPSTAGGWSSIASINVVEGVVLPTVSIGTSGSPAEPSTIGTYTISRTGSTGSALSVNATIGGTATRCTVASLASCATTTDYLLSGCSISGTGSTVTLSIPSGSASCPITLTPKDNTTSESTETATITVTSSASYSLGTTLGSLSITDNDSTVTDYCSDIASNQSSVPSGCQTPASPPGTCIPSGYSWNGSSCVAPVSDYCSDISGSQSSVPSGCNTPASPPGTCIPSGYSWNGSSCVAPVSDYCSDISGSQSSVPSGCNTPASPPGTCIPSGGTWTGSSCTSGSGATFQIDPNDPSIAKGASGSLVIQARRTSGSSAPIYPYFILWNTGSAPSGVTEGGFPSPSCTPGTSWNTCMSVTLTVSNSATAGSYGGTVYFIDGSSNYIYAPFTLTVTGASTFSYTLQPDTFNYSADPGTTIYPTIAAYALSGSGTAGGFYATGIPSGTTYGFSPSECTPTNLSCTEMTIDVGSGTTPGTYEIAVYSSGSEGAEGSTSFDLTVNGEGGGGGSLMVDVQVLEDTGEPGTERPDGVFRLSRAGGEYGVDFPQPVYFEISGTATQYDDYEMGGTCDAISIAGATIPIGSASCDIEVYTLDDSLEESAETITITILPFVNGYND